MAKRRTPAKVYFNPLEILTANAPKAVSLSGPQLAMVSHVLGYAKTHGPAVYGTRENRFPSPVMDDLIAETAAVIDSDVLEIGSWDQFKASVETPITIELTGPQLGLVRSTLSYVAERGEAFFGVPSDGVEQDAYQAIVADALSKL